MTTIHDDAYGHAHVYLDVTRPDGHHEEIELPDDVLPT